MSTNPSTIEFLVQQLHHQANISYRKMFGEYALYCDGKVVALVCDDQLFVKPTVTGKAMISEIIEESPYPGAKPYFLISEDYWSDEEFLGQLILATAQELPIPKPKKKKI